MRKVEAGWWVEKEEMMRGEWWGLEAMLVGAAT